MWEYILHFRTHKLFTISSTRGAMNCWVCLCLSGTGIFSCSVNSSGQLHQCQCWHHEELSRFGLPALPLHRCLSTQLTENALQTAFYERTRPCPEDTTHAAANLLQVFLQDWCSYSIPWLALANKHDGSLRPEACCQRTCCRFCSWRGTQAWEQALKNGLATPFRQMSGLKTYMSAANLSC